MATGGSCIPKAPFHEDPAKLAPGLDAAATLDQFRNLLGKYQFAEDQLVVKQSHLENKLSDLRASIAAIEELKRAEGGGGPSLVDFEIGDTLYTKATVLPTKTVHLWLGANVMLEYPLEEALLLLTSKSGETARAVGEISKQLTFVKEQITTMEVNMARLYNWSRSKNQ